MNKELEIVICSIYKSFKSVFDIKLRFRTEHYLRYFLTIYLIFLTKFVIILEFKFVLLLLLVLFLSFCVYFTTSSYSILYPTHLVNKEEHWISNLNIISTELVTFLDLIDPFSSIHLQWLQSFFLDDGQYVDRLHDNVLIYHKIEEEIRKWSFIMIAIINVVVSEEIKNTGNDIFVSLKDVDECTQGTDDCDDNATCANGVGTFTCTCKTGYTGNGTVCEGKIQ